MNLYEYQSKKLFVQYNLPILHGKVCFNASEIEHYIKNITTNGPWIAKCQICAGGRALAGGVAIVHTETEIRTFSNKWLGNKLITYQTTDIGETVNAVLIEPVVKIMQEFYVSVCIDRDISQIICITSSQGGVNIETLINTSPHLIHKVVVNPEFGLYPYQGRELACQVGLLNTKINQFSDILIQMVRMLLEKDLTLIEINPLVITDNNDLFCLDAKVVVDQNALFRQVDLFNNYINDSTNHRTLCTSKRKSINYVALDGNIGCMVNGAGLAMATMDLIKSFGGAPANFLDIGGDADKDSITSALSMLLNDTTIQVILVNIFGGIVCCNLVADSIITAISMYSTCIPIIVRLEGNNSISGSTKLMNSNLNIIVINDLVKAIQSAISITVKNNVHFD